jgi:hypothetical protein
MCSDVVFFLEELKAAVTLVFRQTVAASDVFFDTVNFPPSRATASPVILEPLRIVLVVRACVLWEVIFVQ